VTRFLLASALLLAACGGGPKVPAHSGYPEKIKAPWDKALSIELDAKNEGKAKGELSYPKRDRARWYVVDLPREGTLEAKLNFESDKDATDLGFEVLDQGFNVKTKAQAEKDIEGQTKKVRSVPIDRGGKAYLHVYTMGKLDEAEYDIKLTYRPRPLPADPRGQFPYTIKNPPAAMAAVPPKDDTPKGTSTTVVVKRTDPVVPEVETGTLTGTIIEMNTDGSSTFIVINKGSNHGVADGWSGYIKGPSGKPLEKGSFKIKKVSSTESEAVVGASINDVQKSRTVTLKAPK
jgi:hypothetical protein